MKHRYEMGKTGAKHHFHSKPNIKNPLDEVPGPSHYSVQDKRSHMHSSANYTIPKGKAPEIQESPGPLSYNTHNSLLRDNWLKGVRIFT